MPTYTLPSGRKIRSESRRRFILVDDRASADRPRVVKRSDTRAVLEADRARRPGHSYRYPIVDTAEAPPAPLRRQLRTLGSLGPCTVVVDGQGGICGRSGVVRFTSSRGGSYVECEYHAPPRNLPAEVVEGVHPR